MSEIESPRPESVVRRPNKNPPAKKEKPKLDAKTKKPLPSRIPKSRRLNIDITQPWNVAHHEELTMQEFLKTEVHPNNRDFKEPNASRIRSYKHKIERRESLPSVFAVLVNGKLQIINGAQRQGNVRLIYEMATEQQKKYLNEYFRIGIDVLDLTEEQANLELINQNKNVIRYTAAQERLATLEEDTLGFKVFKKSILRSSYWPDMLTAMTKNDSDREIEQIHNMISLAKTQSLISAATTKKFKKEPPTDKDYEITLESFEEIAKIVKERGNCHTSLHKEQKRKALTFGTGALAYAKLKRKGSLRADWPQRFEEWCSKMLRQDVYSQEKLIKALHETWEEMGIEQSGTPHQTSYREKLRDVFVKGN